MAYYRIDTASLHTGIKLETLEGTAETLAQTDYVGDWKASLIAPKYTVQSIQTGGDVGNTRLVTSKVYGEMSSFKTPAAYGIEVSLLETVGGMMSQNTGDHDHTLYYDFGGNTYSAIVAPDHGRISTKTLTVQQFDGKESYILSGARPSSLKISAKSGEIVYVDAALQGKFSRSVSSITYWQKPLDNPMLNVLLGNSLTINGTAFDYTDIELDFKPTLKIVESGASATGYSAFEIVDLDPQITLSVYPGDPAIADLWAMMQTNTPVPFAWTFGSGNSNTYTVSALVQFESQEAPYDNNIQTRKIVIKPVYNSATAYKLRIAIANLV